MRASSLAVPAAVLLAGSALGACASSPKGTAAGTRGTGGGTEAASSGGATGGAPASSSGGATGGGGAAPVASSASSASSSAGTASASSSTSASSASSTSASSASSTSASSASSTAASSASSAASSASSSSTAASSSSSAASSASSSSGNPTQQPCTHGPGWIAFRFHYTPNNGTQAILDAFGLPDNSNWQADPVYPTMVTDPANGGGLEIGGNNYILIRYSVAGLTTIQSATFSIYGRSYDVSASGSFDAWSPLYGDDASPTDSVSNVWPYAWTSVDYTGHVQVGDMPGLTGIELSAGPSSGDLVIHTVELCIEGS